MNNPELTIILDHYKNIVIKRIYIIIISLLIIKYLLIHSYL